MRRTFTAIVVSIAILALVLGGCSSTSTTPSSSSGSGSLNNKTVDFIIYATPSTPFFNPVVRGAQDAAKLYGLNVNIQYSNSNAVTQNNQIQTAIASHVAGLAVSIPDNSAFTQSVCAAHSAGIPVVSFNVTATEGPVLNCVLSFVGQDFPSAGYAIAERMIQDNLIPRGAHVFCPVEDATAVYAVGRAQGAEKALSQVGATCDVVSTGFDLSKAQTLEEQYLLGHRNTQVILGLGQVPLQVAPAAAKAAGSQVSIGGFDLSPEISASIKAGSIVATVEQQPYEQGFYTIVQIALKLKYGLAPSDINTGSAIVDKSNVDQVSSLAGEIF